MVCKRLVFVKGTYPSIETRMFFKDQERFCVHTDVRILSTGDFQLYSLMSFDIIVFADTDNIIHVFLIRNLAHGLVLKVS